LFVVDTEENGLTGVPLTVPVSIYQVGCLLDVITFTLWNAFKFMPTGTLRLRDHPGIL